MNLGAMLQMYHHPCRLKGSSGNSFHMASSVPCTSHWLPCMLSGCFLQQGQVLHSGYRTYCGGAPCNSEDSFPGAVASVSYATVSEESRELIEGPPAPTRLC